MEHLNKRLEIQMNYFERCSVYLADMLNIREWKFAFTTVLRQYVMSNGEEPIHNTTHGEMIYDRIFTDQTPFCCSFYVHFLIARFRQSGFEMWPALMQIKANDGAEWLIVLKNLICKSIAEFEGTSNPAQYRSPYVIGNMAAEQYAIKNPKYSLPALNCVLKHKITNDIVPQMDLDPVSKVQINKNIQLVSDTPIVETTVTSTGKIPPQVGPSHQGWSVSDFVERWQVFRQFDWKIDGTQQGWNILSNVVEGKEVDTYPSYFREMMRMHSFGAMNFEFKIQVNTNKFMVGRLGMFWTPPNRDYVTSNHVESWTTQPHVIYDAAIGGEKTLIVPYASVFDMLSLLNHYPGITADDLGSLWIVPLVGLKVPAGAPSVAAGTIWYRVTQAKLQIPAAPHAMFDLIKPQAGLAEVSEQIEDTVASLASQGARQLTRYGLHSIGLDHPLDYTRDSQVRTFGIAQPVHGEGIDSSIRMSLHLARETTDVRQEIASIDEMNLLSLCQMESITVRFRPSWVNGQTGEAVAFPVHPRLHPVSDVGIHHVFGSRLNYVSSRFTFWRGSLRFKFEAVTSYFATGRIAFTWVPDVGINFNLTPSEAKKLLAYPTVVLDLAADREITIVVPFCSTTPNKYVPDVVSRDLTYFYTPVSSNGVLLVQPVNDLSIPATTDPFLEFWVSVTAGDDFELSVPKGVYRSFMERNFVSTDAGWKCGDPPVMRTNVSYGNDQIIRGVDKTKVFGQVPMKTKVRSQDVQFHLNEMNRTPRAYKYTLVVEDHVEEFRTKQEAETKADQAKIDRKFIKPMMETSGMIDMRVEKARQWLADHNIQAQAGLFEIEPDVSGTIPNFVGESSMDLRTVLKRKNLAYIVHEPPLPDNATDGQCGHHSMIYLPVIPNVAFQRETGGGTLSPEGEYLKWENFSVTGTSMSNPTWQYFIVPRYWFPAPYDTAAPGTMLDVSVYNSAETDNPCQAIPTTFADFCDLYTFWSGSLRYTILFETASIQGGTMKCQYIPGNVFCAESGWRPEARSYACDWNKDIIHAPSRSGGMRGSYAMILDNRSLSTGLDFEVPVYSVFRHLYTRYNKQRFNHRTVTPGMLEISVHRLPGFNNQRMDHAKMQVLIGAGNDFKLSLPAGVPVTPRITFTGHGFCDLPEATCYGIRANTIVPQSNGSWLPSCGLRTVTIVAGGFALGLCAAYSMRRLVTIGERVDDLVAKAQQAITHMPIQDLTRSIREIRRTNAKASDCIDEIHDMVRPSALSALAHSFIRAIQDELSIDIDSVLKTVGSPLAPVDLLFLFYDCARYRGDWLDIFVLFGKSTALFPKLFVGIQWTALVTAGRNETTSAQAGFENFFDVIKTAGEHSGLVAFVLLIAGAALAQHYAVQRNVPVLNELQSEKVSTALGFLKSEIIGTMQKMPSVGLGMFAIVRGVESISKIVEKFCAYFLATNELDGLARFMSSSDEITQWCHDVNQVDTYEGRLQMMRSASAQLSMRSLAIKGRSYYRRVMVEQVPANVRYAFMRVFERSLELSYLADKAKDGRGFRRQPFCVTLHGIPGTGKTTFMPHLLREIAALEEHQEDEIYNRNPLSKHWSNYAGHFCVMMDDFPSMRTDSSEMALGVVAEFLNAKSAAPHMVEMASVEEKGRFFTSRVIGITTNNAFYQPAGMLDSAAYFRRRDVLAVVTLTGKERTHENFDHLQFDLVSSSDQNVVIEKNLTPNEFVTYCKTKYVEWCTQDALRLVALGVPVQEVAQEFAGTVCKMVNEPIMKLSSQLSKSQGIVPQSDNEEEMVVYQSPTQSVYDVPLVVDLTNYHWVDQFSLSELDTMLITYNQTGFMQTQSEGSANDPRIQRFHDACDRLGVDVITALNFRRARAVETDMASVVSRIPKETYLFLRRFANQHQTTATCSVIVALLVPMCYLAWKALQYFNADDDAPRRNVRFAEDVEAQSADTTSRRATPTPKGAHREWGPGQSKYKMKARGGEMPANHPADYCAQSFARKLTNDEQLNISHAFVTSNNVVHFSLSMVVEGITRKANISGVGLGGNVVIAPAHFFNSMLLAKVGVINIKAKNFETQLYTSSLKFHFVTHADGDENEQDIVAILLPSTLPKFKNITKQFVPANSLKGLGVVNGLIDFQPNNKPTQHRLVGVNEQTGDAELVFEHSHANPKTLYYVNPTTNQTIYPAEAWKYKIRTFEGDCGTLLFGTRIPQTGARIIGMHVAGSPNASVPIGWGAVITQELATMCLHTFGSVVDDANLRSHTEELCDEQPTIVPQGDFEIFGTIKKPLHVPRKTKLQRTCVWRANVLPHNKDIAVLHENDPRCLEKHTPILIKAISKYGKGSIGPTAFEYELLKKYFVEKFTKITHKWRQKHEPSVTSYETALFSSDSYEFVLRVDPNTSAGYPYVRLGYSKNDAIADFNQGRTGIVEQTYNARLTAAARGETYPAVWIDILKDEKRSIAKVQQGATRAFCICPLDLNLLTRAHFMDFVEAVRSDIGSFDNFITVGINPEGVQWHDLAEMLQSFQITGIADVDYQSFDGTIHPDYWSLFVDVVNEWYGDDSQMVRNVIAEQMKTRLTIAGDLLYVAKWGNPSGCALTSIFNSFVNAAYLRLAWIKLSVQQNKPISVAAFDAFFCDKNFGDDLLLACRSQEEQVQALFKILEDNGIFTTDGSKQSTLIKLKSIADVTFLKRTFRLQPDLAGSQLVGPLDVDSIYGQLHFVTKSPVPSEALQVNIHAAMRDAVFHGSQFYNELRDKLLTVPELVRDGYVIRDYSTTLAIMAFLS